MTKSIKTILMIAFSIYCTSCAMTRKYTFREKFISLLTIVNHGESYIIWELKPSIKKEDVSNDIMSFLKYGENSKDDSEYVEINALDSVTINLRDRDFWATILARLNNYNEKDFFIFAKDSEKARDTKIKGLIEKIEQQSL